VTVAVDSTARHGRLKELLRRFCQSHLNRIILPAAGGTRNPYAVVCHVGRRSGAVHETPVLAFREGRWFVLGLAYGEDCNWCRNVVAAGSCVIRWRGREYRASDPHVIGLEVITRRLSRWHRTLLSMLGVRRYLMLKASEPAAS